MSKHEKEIFADESLVKGHVLRLFGDEPSVMNGIVKFRKWKVTAELVEEPVGKLAERLQHLWDHTRNTHHWAPLTRISSAISLSASHGA